MERRFKYFICASLFFILNSSPLISYSAHAQWWTGWSQQTGLALCIHQSDSSYELYSPLQTSDPIPVSKWTLRNDTLRLECASIGFKATLIKKDSLWNGTWRQGLMKEAITFHPADTLYQLRRPQTPQPPYRFDEETITADYIDSQGNAVHLEGALSYPKDTGPCPTLVLVSGSGQQNRDEEIFFHKPFLVLADYLASRGIAVLRYDDRGVGASTGPLDSADTRLFAEDAEALFKAVKDNPHVDAARLGIGGHSEGLEVLVQQNEAIYRAKGLSDSLLTLRNVCMRDLFALPSGSSQKDYQAVIKRHTAGLTQAQVDSLGLGRGAAYSMKQQMDSRWMQTFLQLDPAEYLSKVKCPVLALNGNKDLQVLPEPNIERIFELCPNADCCLMLGVNHLFQHCNTGSPDEYVLIEETFAPGVMKTIADWILRL